MSPGKRLAEKMASTRFLQIMASHSPLSARLADEAGFDGIWASGFELSALYGLADVSLLSMTQHLDMVRAMTEHCSLPIVADIDTGYGNAVNVIYAIQQYERAGVAAVVMEDKTFPKVTSLVSDGRQQLVRAEEFQGKVEAALSARTDSDFLVIARTEALIAGLGEKEALRRAYAYEEAGAHLILVHSKGPTPAEIEGFVRAWNGTVPIAIVPTAYPDITADRINAFGKVKMVIYGNHAIRACVKAMQDAFARIRADGGLHGVEKGLAPVGELFRLQGMADVKEAEKRFLR